MVAYFEASTSSWDAAAEFVEKGGTIPDRLDAMGSVEVGTTPGEAVYEENKLKLVHFDPLTSQRHDVPILVVYALINRPYILDLQPDRSVVRRLLEDGFDVYLIDWGEPSALDASLTIDDYVVRYLDNCVDVVRERSGVDAINLLGYCMGGTMSAMYAALEPEKVRNLALMAASLYFDDTGGVLELWGDEEYFSPGEVADTFGVVPAEFFDAGFALMDPVQNTIAKYARLYDNVEDEDFVENFARMERWLGEGIDMAGATFEQYVEEIYQENAFAENRLYLDGLHVDLGNVGMPVLQILAEYDHLVPPEASRPFNDAIASTDTDTVEIATGHIGLSVSRVAHDELWPQVCEWFAERSENTEDVERVEGIGQVYAGRLREAGIETLGELAEADPEALADRIDVSRKRTADWVEQARGFVGS